MTKYILKPGMALDLLRQAGRSRTREAYRERRSQLATMLRGVGQVGVVIDVGNAYLTYPSGHGYEAVIEIPLYVGMARKWIAEHKPREYDGGDCS